MLGLGISPLGGAWNPAAKNANITLGTSDTVAVAGISAAQTVQGTLGKSTGVWRYKATVNAMNPTDGVVIGVGNASQSTSAFPNAANGASYTSAGIIAGNSSSLATGLPTYGVGDTIGVVFDAINRTVFFEKNGVFVPGSLVSISYITGALYAVISLRNPGDQITGNFTT